MAYRSAITDRQSFVPGRQRIRHRFLLADGSEAAQVCKDVASLSRDMLVRTADNANANEFVVLTEERFVPVRELPEYLKGRPPSPEPRARETSLDDRRR